MDEPSSGVHNSFRHVFTESSEQCQMFASIEYQIFANCVVFSESLPVRIIFKTGFLSWCERFSFKKPAVIVLKAEESIPQMISSLEKPWRNFYNNKHGGCIISPILDTMLRFFLASASIGIHALLANRPVSSKCCQ